ncbi:prolipoprotein diacylglyceryl transferase [Amaricoccus solimangrovi]|uniref:Phosphatidylglycerol--prolipoprotein diacylglyceryl transferase n=1 Tax=Amaricoccus solimangrovi TaxID=2589815 RepID=A0A501WPR8_9RHOB|nr:prolipoprotein diacylglyceryl transferase [Amaricoccus solimangrovi]TPE51338.1 prolipoprotein diacylglyceryl transferase [Amaricoccus solimangrovi]
MPFVLPFPDIDPRLFSIDLFGVEFAIRWYALAYIAGLVLGWRYVAALCRRPALWGGAAPMPPERTDDLLTWMVLSVILGGRIGYVLFYQPGYFLAHPGQILAVWQGGMSFHGGLIGVATGIIAFCLRNGFPILGVGDAVSAATPIGLFFGRIANFINGELWGKPSTAPWAVMFPGAGATCPPDWTAVCARHPSQLYEAALEGIVLFLVLFLAIRRGALARPGRIFGLFLIGYSLSRMFVELFRQADPQFVTPGNPIGHVIALGGGWGLTMGQLLSLPMLALGLFLWARARRAAP